MFLAAFARKTFALPLLAVAPFAHAFGEPDPSLHAGTTFWTCAGSYLAPRPDGSLLVSTQLVTNQGLSESYGITKFQADGSVATDWGESGTVTVSSSFAWVPQDIIPVADGGVLVAGGLAARITADGRIDTSYGVQGVSDSLSDDYAILSAVLMPDGGILALGMRKIADPILGTSETAAFTRILANGHRDMSFGTGGYILLPSQTTPGSIYAWSVMPDGSVEVGTYTRSGGTDYQFEMHRYPIDFGADPGYKPDNRLLPHSGLASWTAPWISVDANGRVYLAVAASTSGTQHSGVFLRRLDASGKVDPTFAEGNAFIPVTGAYASDPAYVTPKALWRSTDGEWNVLMEVEQGMGGWAGIDVDFATRVARFDSDGSPDPAFAQGLSLGGWQSAKIARTIDGNLVRTDSTAQGCTLARYKGDAPAEGTMAEYYNSSLDHYFMTSEGGESVLLDTTVAGNGWKRTGRTFGTWMPSDSLPGSTKLCRFYGDLQAGPNSHFYTPEGPECDSLRALADKTPIGQAAWRFEGYAGNVTPPTAGQCPVNLTAVYRVYNQGFEHGGVPNHRYTTDESLYAQMQAQGWVGEGVRFCVPPRPNNVSTL